jgi:hypothetical protein
MPATAAFNTEHGRAVTEPDRRLNAGEVAFRWIVMGGISILGLLSVRVLGQIDKTADKVEILQLQVSDMKGTFNSRIDAHVERLNTIDRRNEAQDTKIDALQQRIWRMPLAPAP